MIGIVFPTQQYCSKIVTRKECSMLHKLKTRVDINGVFVITCRRKSYIRSNTNCVHYLPSATFVAAYSGAILATLCAIYKSRSTSIAMSEAESFEKAKLDIYLMDEIAKKPYLFNLHASSSPASPHYKHHISQAPNDKGNSTEDVSIAFRFIDQRPKGVPSRMRILTIDVPQFKNQAFDHGVCQSPSEIFDVKDPLFKDGVAPSKKLDQLPNKSFDNRMNWREFRASRRPIEQKVLAQRLYYCYGAGGFNSQSERSKENSHPSSRMDVAPGNVERVWSHSGLPKIGVEILEASIIYLNPNNIHRTYTSKISRKYDAAKYSQSNSTFDDHTHAENADHDLDDEGTILLEKRTELSSGEDTEYLIEDANDENEGCRTAPWNQYAWMEEMHFRINGLVPFCAPMQKSSFLSHYFYGQIYHQSVPPHPSYFSWFFSWWPFLWGCSQTSDGIDGEGESPMYDNNTSTTNRRRHNSAQGKLNRASNKPHAVIADGAAMQRVPGSLRFLTKTCRQAHVPLYILNDSRSWESNTYCCVEDALVDIQREISENIIRNALDLREGSAFERGRALGRWEKELAWQAWNLSRKTREDWIDAKKRWKKEKLEDWSDISSEELKQKLIERKVISVSENQNDVGITAEKQGVRYSRGLVSLCLNCMERPTSNESKVHD